MIGTQTPPHPPHTPTATTIRISVCVTRVCKSSMFLHLKKEEEESFNETRPKPLASHYTSSVKTSYSKRFVACPFSVLLLSRSLSVPQTKLTHIITVVVVRPGRSERRLRFCGLRRTSDGSGVELVSEGAEQEPTEW